MTRPRRERRYTGTGLGREPGRAPGQRTFSSSSNSKGSSGSEYAEIYPIDWGEWDNKVVTHMTKKKLIKSTDHTRSDLTRMCKFFPYRRTLIGVRYLPLF